MAAEKAAPSVVFIKTISNARRGGADEFWSHWDFFGRRGPVSGAGSGVVLTADGYIVTNNHVIDGADKIEVLLPNKHSYLARIIGTDPSTDLALLKIEARELRPITLGNSDRVRIGEWVLAVGNPLNLTSTVTAGIVSAKGRNINIVRTQFPIESFIQTDAAINPGNSGGALVDAQGNLVGINTAIATKTGAYQGYGFAIPVNIVRKVMRDLIDHGTVQRAFLGADVLDIDATLADRLPDDDYSGVLVYSVDAGSAADKAGVAVDDVLLKIDGVDVNSKAEYLERLAYHSPGDEVQLTLRRKGKLQALTVKLTNLEGTTSVIKKTEVFSETLGCDVVPLTKLERQRIGLEQGGWRVSNLRSGIVSRLGLPDGFVILSVNRQAPETLAQLEDLLKGARGRLIIDGLNPNGGRGTYSFHIY
ncbi:MAG: trypsin-like peptidase domain-containing protein [Bacteroidetes bacterium]|nr:trypsin-like peptidase domain-containing protein [Bacteroidota bacterium]